MRPLATQVQDKLTYARRNWTKSPATGPATAIVTLWQTAKPTPRPAARTVFGRHGSGGRREFGSSDCRSRGDTAWPGWARSAPPLRLPARRGAGVARVDAECAVGAANPQRGNVRGRGVLAGLARSIPTEACCVACLGEACSIAPPGSEGGFLCDQRTRQRLRRRRRCQLRWMTGTVPWTVARSRPLTTYGTRPHKPESTNHFVIANSIDSPCRYMR